MVNVNGANNSEPDLPLSHGKLPQQFNIDVTENVPQKLRAIDTLPSLRPFEHLTIKQTELQQLSIEPIDAFHPPWSKGAGKPKRVSLSGKPKQKLLHHNSELDPLIIWKPDDRKAYDDTRYPWGCVCKIINSAGRHGSGVIVGPRHVLTASHVVDWDKAAGSVEVHRAGPFVSAISAITRTWAYTKIGSGVEFSEVDEDYAVLITADRIGDRFGWLGVRTYNNDWDDEPYWRNIGYPGDVERAMFPIYQKHKALDEDAFDYGSGRSMTTSADVYQGQSGGPMFGLWNKGPYVVAVISSEGDSFLSGDENWCSGGSDMTRLVKHARSADP